MLTFDKLVQMTTDRLVAANRAFEPDYVREILTDAGIDEALRGLIPTPKGRLVIHRVQITGEKRHGEDRESTPFSYARQLGTGLWAWIGRNGSGKSTILNCIIWALTGSESGISRRVRGWIREVAVHFSLGGTHYTSLIGRSVQGGESIRGGIFEGFINTPDADLGVPLIRFETRDQAREQIDSFFMDHLGISTLRWTAHSPQKDDPDLHAHATTWRTYAHAIHIEDDSYDDLIIDAQKGYGRQDRKILEMMLGVDPARAVAEIQVQADFAKESYGRSRSRVGGREEALTGQINALRQEAADISRAVELMQTQPTAVEDDAPLIEKRSQRAELLTAQNGMQQEIGAIGGQIADLERDLLNAERSKVALTEQSEVEFLINSLSILRCPHCESAVDLPDRLERERQDHHCYVCSQPLQKTRVQGDNRALVREREAEIAAFKGQIKEKRAELHTRRAALEASQQQSARLATELQSQVTQARQGFTESYTSLLIRKGQVEGQVSGLESQLAAVKDEQMEVQTAEHWHYVLQTAAEIADRSVFELYQAVFEELSKLVVFLGSHFGVPDLEQVIIDEKRYVRIVQGGMMLGHNDLARSERVKFKVAFHMAMMLLQVRTGLGKHPGLLIIDTPGTAEVNDADFVAINRDLANLNAEYGDQVQILMATARPEAIEALPSEVVESVTGDARFF